MTLQQKAQIALAAERDGDPRWQLLVLCLCARTGLGHSQVVSNIRRLASGVQP